MIRYLLFLFISLHAHALPRVTVEEINGFKVHFVDVGQGNTFGVSFQVPYGTLHDYGRYLGRAHLLEHLMHVGTLKYPGYHAFDELLLPAGVDSNAFTSYDRTFYYASAKDDKAELLVKVFLSMLGGLELSDAAMEPEREVVINEIVEEGIPEQDNALFQMPFVHLLPPGHPWAMSLLGNRPSLSGLSKQDIRDAYNQVYRPGLVEIAIHANLSKPGRLEEIREMLRTNVHASPEQNLSAQPVENLSNRTIPSMFSSPNVGVESTKRLYVHTPDFRYGLIALEGDAQQLPSNFNSQAMGFLSAFMGSELPGSVIHKLKTELGWITEGGTYHTRIRGRHLLFFNYNVSGLGRGHEDEINEIFFRGLRALQVEGVSQAFLERSKSSALYSMETSSRSVKTFLRTYSDVLAREKSFEQQMVDLRAVNSTDLKAAAQIFSPGRALYTQTGPESEGMVLDEVYNRRYKIEDHRTEVAHLLQIMRSHPTMHFNPIDRAVDLGSPRPFGITQFRATKATADSAERVTLDLRGNLPDVAVSADFRLAPGSAADMVALDLIFEAFDERYLAELTHLRANKHVSFMREKGTRNFRLSVAGENGLAARALGWEVRELATFIPTDDELRRARERYLADRDGEYVGQFSAMIAVQHGRRLLDPLESGGMAARGLAEQLSPNQVRDTWSRLRAHADRHLVAAGALAEEDLQAMREDTVKLAPAPLNADLRVGIKNLYAWNPGEYVQEFPKPKGEEAYAFVRFYQGPPADDLKQVAAFQVLGTLLGNQIYIHNRGNQRLGYVHNAFARMLTANHYYLGLYGGTKGDENAAKTLAGWEYVFSLLKSGELTAEIQAAISSVASSLAQEKTSARELVDRYAAGLASHRDPRIYREILAAVRAVTVEDVRESARRYLTGDGTPYTQLTLNGCNPLLSP